MTFSQLKASQDQLIGMSFIEVIDCSQQIIMMLINLVAYQLVIVVNDLTSCELLSYLINFKTKTAGSISLGLKPHYDNFTSLYQTDYHFSIGHFDVRIERIP